MHGMMNASPLRHRRSAGVKVFILLACVLAVVVCEVTIAAAFAPDAVVGQESPAILIAETVEDILANRQHAQTAHTPQRHVAVSKKQLVREVDHQDWHLLDGDQLLPNRGNDDMDVLQKRRERREAAAVDKATPQSILVEPRQPAPHPRRLDCRQPDLRPLPGDPQADTAAQHQRPFRDLQMALDAPAPPHHGGHPVLAEPKTPAAPLSPLPAADDADAAKIALASLRLVVHVTNGQEEEDVEEAKAAAKKAALPHSRPVQQLHLDGPSILLKEPQRDLHVRAVQPVRRVLESAPLLQGNNADGRGAARTAHLVVQDAEEKSSTPKRAYTDEELRQRCVVANGRASQTSTLRAMMEGRLGKDCLVVAADVGNDIPGKENNAKGAVTIVTVFVLTLFVVFASCF